MDELAGINFLCVMEGQDYEQALAKIVSEVSFLRYSYLCDQPSNSKPN